MGLYFSGISGIFYNVKDRQKIARIGFWCCRDGKISILAWPEKDFGIAGLAMIKEGQQKGLHYR